MDFFTRLINFFTLGSDRPVRRLVAYYLVLAAVVGVLAYYFPIVDQVIGSTDRDEAVSGVPHEVSGMEVLTDGLQPETTQDRSSMDSFDFSTSPRLKVTLSTLTILFGVLVLMLPVSWVYMSTRYNKSHDQKVAQTLIFLPLVVAAIVIVVQNSLALAFSLAGVVAAVRFRTTLQDSRDVVFIFLAIAVGFAAGVQALIVAAIVSVVFNFVLILTWRYDFGHNVLTPTPSSQWREPLQQLATARVGNVPDRDLVLALDQKQAIALAERFDRVRRLLGPAGKKPRFNAILSVTTESLSEAQSRVAEALNQVARRWQLDQVETNVGKPSVLYYLVRLRKSTSADDLVTAVRTKATDTITGADVQLAKATIDKQEAET